MGWMAYHISLSDPLSRSNSRLSHILITLDITPIICQTLGSRIGINCIVLTSLSFYCRKTFCFESTVISQAKTQKRCVRQPIVCPIVYPIKSSQWIWSNRYSIVLIRLTCVQLKDDILITGLLAFSLNITDYMPFVWRHIRPVAVHSDGSLRVHSRSVRSGKAMRLWEWDDFRRTA